MTAKISGKWRAAQALLRQFKNFKNWRSIWAKYRKGEHPPVFELRNGLTLHHAEGDDPVFLYREIFEERSYANPRFYQPAANQVVLDIGANIGFFATYLSTQAQKIKIHSFEPAAKTRSTLQKNLDVNELSDVKVYPFGVSDRKKSVSLYNASASGHRSVVNSRFVDTSSAESIECVSLADVFSLTGVEKVDLLKVDTEGSEIEIFGAVEPELLKNVRVVVVEYHDRLRDGCKAVVLDKLKLAGFDMFESVSEDPKDGLGTLWATRSE